MLLSTPVISTAHSPLHPTPLCSGCVPGLTVAVERQLQMPVIGLLFSLLGSQTLHLLLTYFNLVVVLYQCYYYSRFPLGTFVVVLDLHTPITYHIAHHQPLYQLDVSL